MTKLEPFVYPGRATELLTAPALASGTCTIFRTSPSIDRSEPQLILSFHRSGHLVGDIPAPETAVWSFPVASPTYSVISGTLLPYADAVERPCVLAVAAFAADHVDLPAGRRLGYYPHPGYTAAQIGELVQRVRGSGAWNGSMTSIPADLWRASAAIEGGAHLTAAQWKSACNVQAFGRTWARWAVGIPVSFPKQMTVTSWSEWVDAALALATDTGSDADIRLLALGLATEFATQHPAGVSAVSWKVLLHQLSNITVDRTFHGPYTHACDGSVLQPIPDPAPILVRLRAAAATVQPHREAAATK